MSVNITVSGKFRTCSKPSILDDPVNVKKQLECELRKQRLLQVREESKNIARKIRNDVAAEKERQLRNLEAIKTKELECWRKHVLDQKNNEYRQAIFQIGAAHHAAKLENESAAERKATREQERKHFQKKTIERLGVKPPQTTKTILQTAGTQTPNMLMKGTKKKTPKKRKRKTCPKEHTSTCHCSSAESETESEESSYEGELQVVCGGSRSPTTKSVSICPCPKVIKCPCTSASSSSSTLSSTLTDDELRDNDREQTSKHPALSKNPAVIVDIDGDSNDSVIITPGEIRDKHTRSNRQFSHVVRDNSPEIPKRSSLKDSTATMASATTSDGATKARGPRFTQVSRLLNGKSATSGSHSLSLPRPPPPTRAATSATSTQKSPRKSSTSANAPDGIEITLSGATVTLDSGSKSTRDSSVGRVQSYDYNNKYTRDYPHPTDGLVHEPSVRERNEPSAAERAEMERELGAKNYEERERMRARSEERGRKALEREQVRRDCVKLTEKLDALTQQYPQLLQPTDTSLQNHQFQANRAARIEHKRNAAVEELLLRPAIITCPEVDRQQTRIASPQRGTSSATGPGDLNLGAPRASDQINNTGSSDSCCSILLGYVDDQQQQVRNDLHMYTGAPTKQNAQKAERLKNLLQRIEELRKALCEELAKSGSSDGMQQVIKGVSDVQRERERILTNDAQTGDGRISPIEKHMREVKQKEVVLEQKLRELCKMQKQQASRGQKGQPISTKEGSNLKKATDENECRVQATGHKPLEIIIKLKNDGSHRSKSKVKKSTKSPRKLATLINTPARRLGAKSSTSRMREGQQQQLQKGPAAAKQAQINRQNSYDSNSTSYRSLPSRIANEVDTLAERLEFEQVEEGEEEELEDEEVEIEDHRRVRQNGTIDDYSHLPPSAVGVTKAAPRQASSTQRNARLNPLIAHYIQRLLGMSRNSIRTLGVSSSDLETPSSSVMNISSNRTATTTVDLVDSHERLQQVQRFIEDNRSFISELEDTLRSQSDVAMENSIRIFEEVWQQRLNKGTQNKSDKPLKEPQARQRKESQRVADQRAAVAGGARRRLEPERPADDRSPNEMSTMQKPKKVAPEAQPSTAVNDTAPTPRQQHQQQRQSVEQRSQAVTEAAQQKQQKPRQQTQAQANRTRATAANAEARQTTTEPQQKRDISVGAEEHRAEAQIARYEQLTENCTHRIAELTELIQKVRTEKKRLMEITLSSVSEGRNSTEYIELPDGTRRRSNASADRNTSVSSSGSSAASHRNAPTTQPTTSIDYTPQDTLEQQAAATSGEALSAQDSIAPLEKHKPTGISRDSGISISRPLTALDVEPPSQASTTTHTSTQGATRKHRPPPTIQRYSPNFAEDDVAHELSTILEVDTPVTSHLNATTAGSATAATAAAEASRSRRLQPLPFPTFEEYAREMNLDVTQLDADTSLRIHQEFETLVAQLRAAQDGAVPDYREFPSLSAYLHTLSSYQEGVERNQPPETIEDLIASLRIANLSIKAFPSRREYIRQMTGNSHSGEFLDSASLENITDTRTNTNTETDSESLNIEDELRRRQILQHSFRTAQAKEQIFSSTARDGADHTRGYSRIFTTESGVEKLTSTSENCSSEFERQLFSLGMKWPAAMRARTKKAEAAGSSNTSTSPERVLQTDGGVVGAARTAQQRSSPRKVLNDAGRKSPQRSPDTTLRGASPKRVQAVNFSTAKEVQFERHTKTRSPAQSPLRTADRQKPRGSAMNDACAATSQDVAEQQRSRKSPVSEVPTNGTAAHEATRRGRSSRRSPHRSSDCEFLSDFGRPLNLRDFLTKELLKHASSSSSSTPTDESLRSAFLQSIIETMTPRTNAGSNQLDRQKTSTPVTHSAPSDARSSGDRSGGSSGNTPSQLFSGESGISSVRFFERSITRNYPRNAPSPASQQNQTATDEQKDATQK